jgi:hypothetical protein
MADGTALLEINEKGEARLQEGGLNWFDFRLEDVCYEDCEGTDQLASQLPEGTKDVLVLVVFDYVCNCSRGWEGDYDCEELFNIASFTIVKENYKEFYRQMVTEELNIGINGFENLDCIPEETFSINDSNYYKELVGDWEEFYDEDFVPFEKKPKERIELKTLFGI